MAQEEQVEEQADEPGGDVQAQDENMADAVEDRFQDLKGSEGDAATDAPVVDNRGPVSDAEDHLEETDLADDRETLKKIQDNM